MKQPGKRQQELDDAKRYLWHLRAEWRDKFSHDPWWLKKPREATLEAAAWEVLRRHPRAEAIISAATDPAKRRQILNESVAYVRPRIEGVIVQYGLKSWPTLLPAERRQWEIALKELAPQKGIRPSGIPASNVAAFWNDEDANDRLPRLDCFKEMRKLAMQGLGFHGGPDPTAMAEARAMWKAEWSEWCFSQICSGKVPVLLHPDGIHGNEENVVKFLQKFAWKFAGKRGRGNEKKWVGIIEKFERDYLGLNPKQIYDANLFSQYRNRIGDWQWPSRKVSESSGKS